MSADEPHESRSRRASSAADTGAEPPKKATAPADEAGAEQAPTELSAEALKRLRARLVRKYH
jgi:hypothetical protein